MSKTIERNLGIIPVSVGTSIPMEKLTTENPFNVKTIYFNIRTLFRNYIGSFPEETYVTYKEDTLVEDFIKELDHIAYYLTHLKFLVNIYYPSYSKLKSDYKNAKLKFPTTPKQKAYSELEKRVLDKVSKQNTSIIKSNYSPNRLGDMYIVTHHMVDITSSTGFGDIYLLESHTGEIKTKATFGSKLTGVSDPRLIPLNKLTIQIYGDGPVNFYSMSFKIKNAFTEMAKERRYDGNTTMSRIRTNIESIRDNFLRRYLTSLL